MKRQDIINGLDGQEQQIDVYEYNRSEKKQGEKGKGGGISQSSKHNYNLKRENDGRDISNITWSKEQDMSSFQIDTDHPKQLSELSSSLSSQNIFSERKNNNPQEYAKFDYHKTQDSRSSQLKDQNVDFELSQQNQMNIGSVQHRNNLGESKQRCLNSVRSNRSINSSNNSMNISQQSQQQYTSQQQNKRFFREQQSQKQYDQVGLLQKSNSKLQVQYYQEDQIDSQQSENIMNSMDKLRSSELKRKGNSVDNRSVIEGQEKQRFKMQEKDEDYEDQVLLHAAATQQWEKNIAIVPPIVSVEKYISIEDIVKAQIEKALEKLLRKERMETENTLSEIKEDFKKQLNDLGQKLSENTAISCQAVDKKLELFLRQYTITKNSLTEELAAIKVRETQIQRELMELAEKFNENQVFVSAKCELLEKSENSKSQKTTSDAITTTGTSTEEFQNGNNELHEQQEECQINRNVVSYGNITNENQQDLVDQDQDLQAQGLLMNNMGIISQPQSQPSLSQQSALIQSNSPPGSASKREISILPMTHSNSSPSMFSISSNPHSQPQQQQLQQDQQQQQLLRQQQQQSQSNLIDYESFSSQPQSSWISQQPIMVNAIHKYPNNIINPNDQLIVPFPEEAYQYQQEEHPMIIVNSPQKQQQLSYYQSSSSSLQPTVLSSPPVVMQTLLQNQNQSNQSQMIFQQNFNNFNYQQMHPQQQYSTLADQTSLVNVHIQPDNFQPTQMPQIQQLNTHPNYYYSLNNNMSNNNQTTLSSRFAELSNDQEEFHRQVDSYLADRKIPGKLAEILGQSKYENNKESGQNILGLEDIKSKYLTSGRHSSRHSSSSSVQSSEIVDQVELELDSFTNNIFNNIEEHNGLSINNNNNVNVSSQLQTARDDINAEVIVPMSSQKNLLSHQLAVISEQENEEEFILYQMDERGNLLDEHGRYIVDAMGGHVAFSQNQIYQLRQQNLLEDL